MAGKYRTLLRVGGLGVLVFAFLGNLPDLWTVILGIAGILMFFLAGPT